MTWQKWSEAKCLAYPIRPQKSKIKHLFSVDFPGSKGCWQVHAGYACLCKKSFIALARKRVTTSSTVHWYQTFSHIQQNCNISVWCVDKSSCKKVTHGYLFEWHKRFLDGWEEVYDDPTYGEPKSTKTDESMKKKLWKSVGSYNHLMIRLLEWCLTCWTLVWNQFQT